MSDPQQEIVDAWIAKAVSDLLNIANNLRAERVPWDSVCYHSQQAAEKMLKAFIVAQGADVPRTHDLGALLEIARSYDSALADLLGDCAALAPYASAVRYPFAAQEPTETDARAMVAKARRIAKAIAARISPESEDPLEALI